MQPLTPRQCHVPSSLPGHGLTGEELQLVVVQTETGQREQTGEGLRVQVVQSVVTETKPFDVLQTLEGEDDELVMNVPTAGDIFCIGGTLLPGRPCWECRPAGCV